jgi:hypothetical protein
MCQDGVYENIENGIEYVAEVRMEKGKCFYILYGDSEIIENVSQDILDKGFERIGF